jgi:hypothetical protein
MSDVIYLTIECEDEFLDGKKVAMHFTYNEADNEGSMGAYQPECYTLDAVTYGSGEYLDSLNADEIKHYEKLRLEMEYKDRGERQIAAWESSATDHYLACTKGY